MGKLLGYKIGTPYHFWGGYSPDGYEGIGTYFMWPLNEEESCLFKKALTPDQQNAFLIQGELPNDILVQSLVKSIDYIAAYKKFCDHRNYHTTIFAFGTGRLSLQDMPGIQSAEFLGFDCLGSDGLSSYLYWDAGWQSFQKEIEQNQIHFNQNQLFLTEEDARKYAFIRRSLLVQGINIEEMGEEIIVSITKVRL